MSKIIVWFIVGLIIGLVIGGASGYFYANKSPRGNFGNFNNFQINEESKAEVTSFFEGNPDEVTLTSYCQQNMNNCMYYCREVNKDNEACNQILNMSGEGVPPKR